MGGKLRCTPLCEFLEFHRTLNSRVLSEKKLKIPLEIKEAATRPPFLYWEFGLINLLLKTA